jgi:hypothetical protein
MQQAQAYVGQLILANRDTLTAGNVSEGMIAKVATDLASGAVKPIKVGIKDKDGNVAAEVDAVRLPNGGLLYLNADQIRGASGRMGQREEANKSAPPGDPKNEPAVRNRGLPPAAKAAQDNMNSPQTKAARVQLLEDELTAERAKPDSPQRAANIAGLEKEISAITKTARPGLQPVAAPAPAPTPAAPPPAAGLTPVAPEDFKTRQANALRRQEAIKSDPDVQALQRKRADALRSGKPAQANAFLSELNALVEKRYPAFGTNVAAAR